jgi:alpha-N-acetylglucosaminidase
LPIFIKFSIRTVLAGSACSGIPRRMGENRNSNGWFCLGILCCLFTGTATANAADDFSPVRGLIERIAPGHADDFVFEIIPAPAGQVNAFEVGSKDGKILLGGDSQLSLAVAFNYYLKHDALAAVSWYVDDAVTIPKTLPIPADLIHRSTAVKDRFFLNYCTFGYTMPFWRWRDWERGIDWMALNGINLPLAQNGNEYIWQKVWREYGLSDDQIRGFFTGPAHLPWHRMVNIDHWDGPLPQSSIDGQHDLQKQILARERELGMRPILCAFAGHVPEALKTAQPDMKIERIPPGWGGFSKAIGCWFLNPLDPKFHEIQVKFLKAQKAEYGESHYLGTDPFNEIAPPSWEPSYLAATSKAIYDGMAEVDPQAIWMQMAWTFNSRKSWTDERCAIRLGLSGKFRRKHQPGWSDQQDQRTADRRDERSVNHQLQRRRCHARGFQQSRRLRTTVRAALGWPRTRSAAVDSR